MESFFTRYRNALVLLVVLVLQLLALAIQAKRPPRNAADPEAVSLLRYAVITVITPPEKALHLTGLWFRNLWFGYIDLIHVRRDNAALKNQLEQLRLEEASVVEDARQGQRLQRLLDFKQHYIYQTVPAQVVGASGTDQSSIVYIDKGANDGLKTDMPVMTADGIVGRLKDVFPTTSQLMLISDATSGVGVIVESTRTRGVLKGGSFGQVQVINVSPDDRIKPGDKIITSGGDQIFPRGMPVGTVESVSPDPDRDPLVDIAVRPAANLSQLEEVLVITSTGDAISTQEARDMAESEAEGQAAQKRASDILSERLPSRIDPRAPADTNPDENVDSTGNLVKPLTPPKPLHPDGFSPGATPPASDLTPGARTVPVKNGTEELPPPKATAPKPADKAAEATPTATTDAAATPHKAVQLDAEGNPVPARPKTESAATAATRTGKAIAPATGATPGSPSGNTVSTAPHRQTPAPAGATTSTASPAARALVPGSSAARPATTTAPLKPSTTTRVIVDGPEDRTPAATPAARTPASTAAKPVGSATPRSATPAKRSPILVPDDGSRPPRTTTPRQPAQTSQPQTPAPQGMGA